MNKTPMSNYQAINNLFHTDEERNIALDDAYDVGVAASIMRSRHARNLTQEEFAEKMGVSQSYVAQLENANVLPSHKKLKLIARILKANLWHPRIVVEENMETEQVIINTCTWISNGEESGHSSKPIELQLSLNQYVCKTT